MAGPATLKPFYIQSLYTLGLLGLTLNQLRALTPIAYPTLKRYLYRAGASNRLLRAAHDRRPTPAPFDGAAAQYVTSFWCRQIAGLHTTTRVPQGRPLLSIFCPSCVAVDGALGGDPNDLRGLPAVTTEFAVYFVGEPALVELYVTAAAWCASRRTPTCLTGPARFGLMVALANLDPWDAAWFLKTEVRPERWWVRECLKCTALAAGPSPTQTFCPEHLPEPWVVVIRPERRRRRLAVLRQTAA